MPPAACRAERAPALRFGAELERQAEKRHARLLGPDGLPRTPAGFRAEDFSGEGGDGYVTIAEACRLMGCDEAQLLDFVGRGLVEAERRGGVLFARPAILSVSTVVVR